MPFPFVTFCPRSRLGFRSRVRFRVKCGYTVISEISNNRGIYSWPQFRPRRTLKITALTPIRDSPVFFVLKHFSVFSAIFMPKPFPGNREPAEHPKSLAFEAAFAMAFHLFSRYSTTCLKLGLQGTSCFRSTIAGLVGIPMLDLDFRSSNQLTTSERLRFFV